VTYGNTNICETLLKSGSQISLDWQGSQEVIWYNPLLKPKPTLNLDLTLKLD